MQTIQTTPATLDSAGLTTYPESKARDVAHENCLDLKHMHNEQDADFFIKNGGKAGAARQLVRNIARWVTQTRNPNKVDNLKTLRRYR